MERRYVEWQLEALQISMNKENFDSLYNIVNDKSKIKIKQVANHKDIEGQALLEMLYLIKKD